MTISQALKRKNKIVKRLQELKTLIISSNSRIKGNKVHYNIINLLDEYYSFQEELVSLKVALMKANEPVLDKIFLLAELKGTIVTVLNQIPVKEGFEKDRYNGEVNEYEVTWNSVDVDKLKKTIESRIEEIQEKLDHYNHTTELQ